MKNLFILFLFGLGLLAIGCGDKCDDVNCGENGTCVEGTCDCDDGYIGTLCDTENRAKFIGTWNSIEWICDGEEEDGTVLITNGATINEILVTNPDADFSLNGTVSGNSFTMPVQQIDFDGTILDAQGSGTLANNVMTFTFTASLSGVEVVSCAGTFTM